MLDALLVSAQLRIENLLQLYIYICISCSYSDTSLLGNTFDMPPIKRIQLQSVRIMSSISDRQLLNPSFSQVHWAVHLPMEVHPRLSSSNDAKRSSNHAHIYIYIEEGSSWQNHRLYMRLYCYLANLPLMKLILSRLFPLPFLLTEACARPRRQSPCAEGTNRRIKSVVHRVTVRGWARVCTCISAYIIVQYIYIYMHGRLVCHHRSNARIQNSTHKLPSLL